MRADAIVILGCRIHAGGRLSGAAERRVARAARAFQRGVAPVVVATGGRRWSGQLEANALRSGLVAHGVPASAIVRECCSYSTRENAVYSARLLVERGLSRAAVVTCSWHMDRALACFRAAGLEASALPADAPRASPLVATKRRVYEMVSGWIDTWAIGRRSG